MVEQFGFWIGLLLLATAAIASALAAFVSVRAVVAARASEGPGGFAWQSLLFAIVLDLLVAAAFGVGNALELLVEGWASILGIVGGLFGGWLGYKVGKLKVDSKGSTTTPIEGG